MTDSCASRFLYSINVIKVIRRYLTNPSYEVSVVGTVDNVSSTVSSSKHGSKLDIHYLNAQKLFKKNVIRVLVVVTYTNHHKIS